MPIFARRLDRIFVRPRNDVYRVPSLTIHAKMFALLDQWNALRVARGFLCAVVDR